MPHLPNLMGRTMVLRLSRPAFTEDALRGKTAQQNAIAVGAPLRQVRVTEGG